MASQTDVLRALARSKGPLNITAICLSLDVDATSMRERKSVIRAIGNLVSRKLVSRVKPPATDKRAFEPPTVTYQATADGRKFAAAGKEIEPGPRGPHTGPFKEGRETLRARVWSTLRTFQKATIPELLESWLSADDDEKAAADNVAKYLKALVRAGVVVEMKVRSKGFAPTSNGFKRFMLMRDLGPKAPQISRGWVFDQNRGERIAYAEDKKSRAA